MKLRIGYVSRNLTTQLVISMLRRPSGALLGALVLYGCASAGSPARPAGDAEAPVTPLTGLLGRQLLVLPTQYLSVANPGGGRDIAPGGANLTPIMNQEIEDVFRARGVKANWTFARQIVEMADRQGGLTGDPRDLHAANIRRVKAGDTPLPEPTAGDIRNLVALTSARYVLLPIEVNVDVRDNTRSGSLRVLLVDSRTSRVTWADDIIAPPDRDPQVVSDAFTPYGFRRLARVLATKLADIVAEQ